MEKITASVDLDVAYGRTPEAALLSVLAIQPAFDYRDAYYHGERPAFMDVVAKRGFNEHEWEQYEQREGVENLLEGRGDGVGFQKILRYDEPMTADQRIEIRLTNVWLEVPWQDGRADVKFRFSIMLRESELEDDNELRDGDHHWRCERISTQPIDENQR